jgi:hypothetical protein
MSLQLLRALPPANEIEAKLRLGGAILANSETQRVLDRYRSARAALARTVAAASAAAFGVAIAAASEQEMTPKEAERVAREAAAYLEALVTK